MALLRFDKVSIAFHKSSILDCVNLQVHSGERLCLLGRNGEGKSTALKLAARQIEPDSGHIVYAEHVRIGLLEQMPPEAVEKTIFDVVAEGLNPIGQLLQDYQRVASDPDHDMEQLAAIGAQIDAQDGWQFHNKINRIIGRLQLRADQTMHSLSGGWRRRVELARALVREPQLLILDEPTNHLDIMAIQWLESELLAFKGAILFVTHDRHFLQAIATGIIELDRGQIYRWQGDYASYLEDKAHRLAVEQTANAQFDKRLKQEETWVRQGIQARRTRNEGRVRALQELRRQRQARQTQQGNPSFLLEQAKTSGKLVLHAEKIYCCLGNLPIVQDFTFSCLRGDKIGLIGANGIGKTTLLRLLLGKNPPDSGAVQYGTRIEVAYFDQLREQLEAEKTVLDNVAEGRQSIEINGKQQHIMSYLQDFLFTPETALSKVRVLSGGERNRVLLAKLFSKPANVLVLDEPTNDLDIETLELLESLLVNFQGTVLLVSHDRAFLDAVTTSSLVFQGQGVISEYVGGFSDWLRQGGTLDQLQSTCAKETMKTSPPTKAIKKNASTTRKLSYKEQQIFERLPQEIETLEEEQGKLHQATQKPDFFQQPISDTEPLLQRLADIERQINDKMDCWAELESRIIPE